MSAGSVQLQQLMQCSAAGRTSCAWGDLSTTETLGLILEANSSSQCSISRLTCSLLPGPACGGYEVPNPGGPKGPGGGQPVAGPPAVSILLSAPAVGPLLARLQHLHVQPGSGSVEQVGCLPAVPAAQRAMQLHRP